MLQMFNVFGGEIPEAVAKCGYKGVMRGKTVVYHGRITHGFNIITRITTRKFARNLARKLN